MLREVALSIKARLRALDALGRYGAAQFLLLLPATTQEEARLLAEEVRQGAACASPAARRNVTVSIGLAQFRAGESIGQTMARADDALVQATSNGRNRVFA